MLPLPHLLLVMLLLHHNYLRPLSWHLHLHLHSLRLLLVLLLHLPCRGLLGNGKCRYKLRRLDLLLVVEHMVAKYILLMVWLLLLLLLHLVISHYHLLVLGMMLVLGVLRVLQLMPQLLLSHVNMRRLLL